MYQLEMGSIEAAIIRASIRQDRIPPRIQNAPELNHGLEFYYRAFSDLTNSRQVGMGLGPICWQSIVDYCRYHELDREETDTALHFITAMDVAFLEHHAKITSK